MNRPLALLALACAWLVISCAGLTQASTPPFVYTEPSVFRYESTQLGQVTLVVNIWERAYIVPGTSASEVGDNLGMLRRAGTGHGPYSASTKWDFQIGLRYASEPDGCRIASATVELVALITMPGLQSPESLDYDEMARWEGFIARLKAHELEHIGNQTHGGQRLQEAIAALPSYATCGEAGEVANALTLSAEQEVLHADVRLDAETKHGALTGATFP